MKKIFLLIIIFTIANFANAQKVVAVLSGSNWTFYDDFSPALRAAPAGATIYVPGGTFDLGTNGDTINKPITIIGVGHYPDSTIATNKTTLVGNIVFVSGSDNTTLIGFELQGDILTRATSLVYNTFIKRIRCTGIGIYNGNNSMINVTIDECIFDEIGYINGSGSSYNNNLKLSNSILSRLDGVDGSTIKNCNIINATVYSINNCDNCLFENNIIINNRTDSILIYDSDNNVFINTLVSSRFYFDNGSTGNTFLNYYTYASLANTFTNVIGYTFIYNYDYQLKSTSIGKNAGTDGTDIGIYGSAYPYKEGAVPPNPHISTKSIAPISNSNGTLPVNIKVVAQDR